MANIKPKALGFISFLMGLFLLVFPARAENWVETTVAGYENEPTFYDSDSAYVDVATGLVVIEKAAMPASAGGEFWYYLTAYDCSRWEYYSLGILQNEGWWYDLYGELEVTRISGPPTAIGQTAKWACDNYNSHPAGNIPFDFKFSNY